MKSESSGPLIEAGSREKLCEVGLRLFAEKGLEGVSTRDLAGAAGVNISLISYYFGGKEGLYKEVLRNFADEAQKQMNHLLSSHKPDNLTRESYISTMTNLANAIVEFKSARPHIAELMMREMVAGLPHAREICETVFDGMTQKVTDLMSAAQKKKIIRADVNVHLLFFSMVHSVDCYFMALRCSAPMTKRCSVTSNDQVVDHIVKVYVEGVLL